MEETEYSFLRSRELCVVLNDERGIIGFPRLSANVDVVSPARCGEVVAVFLDLASIDGKQLVYQFLIDGESGQRIATGQFIVASCRFPEANPPYAILTPDYVIQRLSNATKT